MSKHVHYLEITSWVTTSEGQFAVIECSGCNNLTQTMPNSDRPERYIARMNIIFKSESKSESERKT